MLSDSCNVKLSWKNDNWCKVNFFPEKAFSINIFMETGFNIVEVPGSKSRKVAGKKQQWYRTAILKKFRSSYKLPITSYFNYNSPFDCSFFKILYHPDLHIRYGSERKLIIHTVSKLKSVFNSELQKTVRNIFSGFTSISVKSNLTFMDFLERQTLLLFRILPVRRAIHLKNK